MFEIKLSFVCFNLEAGYKPTTLAIEFVFIFKFFFIKFVQINFFMINQSVKNFPEPATVHTIHQIDGFKYE